MLKAWDEIYSKLIRLFFTVLKANKKDDDLINIDIFLPGKNDEVMYLFTNCLI